MGIEQITPTQSSRSAIMFWNPRNGQFHVLPPIPHPVMPDDLEDYYNEIRRDPFHCFYGGCEFDPLSEDYEFNGISEYGDKFSNLYHLLPLSSEDSLASNNEVATITSVGVMKEYGIEEPWIKACRIVLSASVTFLGIVEDELFVKETDGWVVSYRLGAHREDYNEYCYAPFQELEILPFEGSFIPKREKHALSWGNAHVALHWHKLCSAIIILCDERRARDLSKVNFVAMNLKTDYAKYMEAIKDGALIISPTLE
ncbi:hypothetical protein Cgig2_009433 [Carnegiea gigantea]|uniref:Uncharacterized protein n=1 Tax=Carnegiea gigantea TaxID=171969 RepID=A0A9Q1JSS0_9CARY|nr:hypothetical protein Cgig2_009433 [Carnegiea gigantea]